MGTMTLFSRVAATAAFAAVLTAGDKPELVNARFRNHLTQVTQSDNRRRLMQVLDDRRRLSGKIPGETTPADELVVDDRRRLMQVLDDRRRLAEELVVDDRRRLAEELVVDDRRR